MKTFIDCMIVIIVYVAVLALSIFVAATAFGSEPHWAHSLSEDDTYGQWTDHLKPKVTEERTANVTNKPTVTESREPFDCSQATPEIIERDGQQWKQDAQGNWLVLSGDEWKTANNQPDEKVVYHKGFRWKRDGSGGWLIWWDGNWKEYDQADWGEGGRVWMEGQWWHSEQPVTGKSPGPSSGIDKGRYPVTVNLFGRSMTMDYDPQTGYYYDSQGNRYQRSSSGTSYSGYYSAPAPSYRPTMQRRFFGGGFGGGFGKACAT